MIEILEALKAALGKNIHYSYTGNRGPDRLHTVSLNVWPSGNDDIPSFEAKDTTHDDAFLAAARQLISHFNLSDQVLLPATATTYRVRVWQEIEIAALTPEEAQRNAVTLSQYAQNSWRTDTPEALS